MSFFQKLFSSGPSTVLGLDIGSSAIKIAQLGKTTDGLKIHKLAIAPTPPMAMKDGNIVEIAPLAEKVKELVRQNNLTVKQVVSAVTGQSIVIRTISLPVMTDRELKNSIQYEAEKYIPYSVAEAQVDGIALRRPIPGDEKNMEVLLMAAPKEMVRNAEEVIRQAGFQVQAIDLEPFALLRLIRNTLDADILKQTVALINIGASSTSINIFREGMLRNSRTIAMAGNAFTKAIAQGMSLSFDDAEKLKKEKGTIRIEKDSTPVAPTTMRMFNTILPVLTELVTEIQRSFDFYRSRYKGESVDVIYLSGGTARFKNLDRYLAGELSLHVELFNPFAKVKGGGIPGFSSEESEEIAQSVSVVLGLASWHLD